MAQTSYDETTIGEITAKAGITRSTYDRNFRSTDEVVSFDFNQIIHHHIEPFPAHPVWLEKYLPDLFPHDLESPCTP